MPKYYLRCFPPRRFSHCVGARRRLPDRHCGARGQVCSAHGFFAAALGAALTAIANGIILVRFDGAHGIGSDVLHVLAGIALIIGTTSLTIVVARPVAWPLRGRIRP